MKDLPTPEELARHIEQHGMPKPEQNRDWLRAKLDEMRVEMGVINGVAGSVQIAAEEDDTARRVRFCTLVDAASALLRKAENVLYGGH